MYRIRAVAIASLLIVAALSAAQDPGQASRDALKKLGWMAGKWKGSGSMQRGPGAALEATVEETVTPKLNGLIYMVEGLGRAKESPDRIVHNAFAVLSYNATTKKYAMRPTLASGEVVDAKVEVEDDGTIRWGFELPNIGEVRYVTRKNEKGQWHEVGELSRDKGATWAKFFEMTLDRVSD